MAQRTAGDLGGESTSAPTSFTRFDDRHESDRDDSAIGRVDALLRANPSLVHEIE